MAYPATLCQKEGSMHQFIQNILIYVVIITVLRGIITNDIYKQYFKFVSGLVMILLMISPILNFIYDDGEWYKKIEETIMQSDIEDVNDELKAADGGFEDMIIKNCKSEIEDKVEKMAEKEGVRTGDIDVDIKKEDDEISLCSIDVEVIKNNKDVYQKGDSEENKSDSIQVDAIKIGEVGKSEKTSDNKQKLSDSEKKLKSDICDYFVLGKDRVTLWH